MNPTKNKKTQRLDDRPAKHRLILLGMAVVLFILFIISFYVGRYGVDVISVCKILYQHTIGTFLPIEQTWTDTMEAAVINVRLPRIVMACMVGCCLAAAGAAYQGVFQNPMASPDILGASSGAAFGAALAILLGMPKMMITVFAFVSSLVTVFLVMLVAKYAPGMKIINLILAGMMISSLFTAGTSYIKLVADPTDQLPKITYWLMGSLTGVRTEELIQPIIPMAIGLAALMVVRWQINLLSLGEDEARTLGVNTGLVRVIIILASTLVTAASISVTGMIGWVGLVIPHLCRKINGSNYRWLIPSSMLGGAIFLLLVDDFSRNLSTMEIPIGILTAFVGAPFFIYLLMRKDTTV